MLPAQSDADATKTSLGQMHLAEAGTGEHVLFLRQTLRPWTECIHVLPMVGSQARAIALDTLGFGQSAQASVPSIGSSGR